jgi:S-methylmethionine-dependent homocysteine/selenocysteine methylase
MAEIGGTMLSQLKEKPVLLLDGGMGRELHFRGVEVPETIWSAASLLSDPEVVQQIHQDFIKAGADIITTNTYGVIASDLAKVGLGKRFKELNKLACTLAANAIKAAGKKVAIAGSLPPLRGSYRPDLVGPLDEIEMLYEEQVAILAPHVDLLICETMSSGREALAAARAACKTGKPVWIAWALSEDRPVTLRSGETIEDAIQLVADLPVSGYLGGCSAPESITSLIPRLANTGKRWFGGYANTFTPIPKDWELNGNKESDGLLNYRDDLTPLQYGRHAADWLEKGATVVGGCCGTRPAHIAEIRRLIDAPGLAGHLNR